MAKEINNESLQLRKKEQRTNFHDTFLNVRRLFKTCHKRDEGDDFKSAQEAQVAGGKKKAKKSPGKPGHFLCFKEFKGLEAVYGAADGTRTRDPRRDRPVF